MNKNILAEFDESTAELLKAISLFSQEELNKVPFEGSWTAAQVAEHVLKSDANAAKVLIGKTAQTEREADEKEAMFRKIFLDFTTKMKSPEFIIPSDEPMEKIELYKDLENECLKIRDAASGEDISLTCMDFSFPGMGELTKYEWICFVICHTKRHTHQMKNIYEKICPKPV